MTPRTTPAGLTARSEVTTWVQTHDRDQLSRRLRVSLTDACNLGCFFCHNEGQAAVARTARASSSIDDLVSFVRAAVRAGVREVKLTGGEPLLYRDGRRGVVDLVRRLAELRSDQRDHFGLSMTTNGVLLGRLAPALKQAGLDRVTVSLHTLDQSTFTTLIGPRSRPGLPAAILAAVGSAVEVGLTPVKVNTVVFGQGREGNAGELADIVWACRSAGVASLRLYSLLNHSRFEDHDRWYRFWDRDLLVSVGSALYRSDGEAGEFADRVEAFLRTWRRALYPKPTFVADAGDLQVELEAMESGRFQRLGVADEGPYALRLSAAGELRGSLEGPAQPRPLPEVLRRGGEAALERAFRSARRRLLP